MAFNTLLTLGIFAGVLQFAGYATYLYDVLKRGIKPNPASWLAWSYGNALVCLSYIYINSELSFAVDVLPIVCGVTCIVMTIAFIYLGKFRPLEKFEKIIISIDILITIFWALSSFGQSIISSLTLHIIFLASTIISFVSLYKEIIYDGEAEKPKAWLIWTAAYLILVIIGLGEGGGLKAVSYPLVCVLLHAAVAALSSKHPRRLLKLKVLS